MMPANVIAAIEAHQDQGDRLTAWVQLAVALTFGALYALGPASAPAYPLTTPAIIGIYLVFTVLCLRATYRRRLAPWMLATSVIMDMALLFGLLWSFHLQYQQPAPFYLKAPTLLYAFIFIALRALRFEVRYLALAGATAAAGWLLLAAYAIWANPADPAITHDYVQYLTSNSVLPGAEFDKIVSLLAVTAILVVAVVRARRLLLRAVLDSQARRNLSRFFEPDVARFISRNGDELAPGSGETRDVAILNLDLRGFTKLAADCPPDRLMAILADYQRTFVPIIQRHGGSIDKFLGDGIMATFGATRVQDDYASRALRALEEVTRLSAGWTASLKARHGHEVSVNGAVASGSVICGAVGDETRLEYTVIGDAVNLSAKLEKHNKVLGSRALTTASTYAQALEQGFRPAEPPRPAPGSRVAGVAATMDLVALG